MPVLDYAEARDLLLRVVNRFYAERHSPPPGAFVKAQMLVEAQSDGGTFSERELGFRRFIDFIKQVPEIAIQGRSGSDILLAPVSATEILAAYAGPLPRLRRDFWRAFIEFPVEGTVRIYDPDEDKILHVEAGAQRPGIVIDPVSRDTQLQWRRTFSEEQSAPMKERLLAAINAPGGAVFNEFARRIRENIAVSRSWNRYLQKQITDYVAEWAARNGVAEERWIAPSQGIPAFRGARDAPSKPPNVSQRAELYNFFDQLPIEDLLQLRVPLEWVLKVTRRGDA
jgi:hypothetical protein